jgi:RND family efflux transporter MFP subunit
MNGTLRQRVIPVTIALASIAGQAGCRGKNELKTPLPPKVTVAAPFEQDVVETIEFTGNTRATATVDLRARVSGYLHKIAFQDGAMVKEGDLLFVIEQAPFKSELEAARARLQKAEATSQLAEANLARTTRLAKENASTQQQVDIQIAEKATALADVAAAKVAVEQAQLDLSYTEIRAPISGQIGRHMVDVGNLIQTGNDLLATIQSIDPIFAYFYVSESQVLRFMELIRTSEIPDPTKTPVPLKLGLGNETDFPHPGHLDFRELGVDPTTGTILRRATFENPDRTLIPGLFVRIRAELGSPHPKLLVEERALGADQRGDFLLVVDDKDVVQYRPVKLGIVVGNRRVIEQGVARGERVIVNGLQRARPGAQVVPEGEATVAAKDAAPAASSSQP